MNQDALTSLLNRIPWGILLFGYLAWQGVQLYQFKNSEDSPLLMKRAEISQAEAQIDQLRKKVKEAQDFQKSLDVKREEIRQLAAELATMRAGLSEDFDVPELIQIVTREANLLRLNVLSLAPTEEKKHEYYTEKVFNLKFTGLYVQLIVFLDRIASLQKILRVEGLGLRPAGPQNTRFVELFGSLDIIAYRYNGSKADTIGVPAAGTSQPAPAGAKSAPKGGGP